MANSGANNPPEPDGKPDDPQLRVRSLLERLHAIARDSSDAITAQQFDGTILAWNQAATAMYGYPESEAVGRSVQDIIPPRLRAKYLSLLETIRDGGRVEAFETQRIAKDGRILEVWVTLSPLRDDQGQTVAVSAIGRDITERNRAAKDLEESHRFLQQIIDSLPDHIAILDVRGEIVLINRAWEDHQDQHAHTIEHAGVGRNYIDICRGHDGPGEEHARDLLKALEDIAAGRREQFSMEYPCHRPDRQQWYTLRVSTLHSEGQRYMLLSHQDITGLKRAEQDILAHRDRLEEAVKERTAELQKTNDALRQFARVASHDLDAPLRQVRTFCRNILDTSANQLPPQATEDLDRIMRVSGRMRHLIHNLLALSRASSRTLDREEVDLTRMAEDVREDLAEMIREADATVTIEPMPVVHADRTMMRQLLQNLLSNAVKFRSPHRPCRVTLRGRRHDGPDGAHVRLEVEDNGEGIATDQQERIFDAFHRLQSRSKSEGSGIGLSICRNIVEAHGGDITVQSTPDRGSLFLIILPEKPL